MIRTFKLNVITVDSNKLDRNFYEEYLRKQISNLTLLKLKAFD